MRALGARLGAPVEPIEAIGYDGDVIEAQCFAYLALRSRRGLPLSLPTTTGAPRPMRGRRVLAGPQGRLTRRSERSGAQEKGPRRSEALERDAAGSGRPDAGLGGRRRID